MGRSKSICTAQILSSVTALAVEQAQQDVTAEEQADRQQQQQLLTQPGPGATRIHGTFTGTALNKSPSES